MRYLVGHYHVSQWRACRVVKATRSLVYYRSRKDPLTALRQRMRELAQTRVRFGYRRLLVLLRREGGEFGKERFYRVYTDEGLALRRKRPWRHATAVHSRATAAGDDAERHLEHGLRGRRVHGRAAVSHLDRAGSSTRANVWTPRRDGAARARTSSRRSSACDSIESFNECRQVTSAGPCDQKK
jgi:hypothetical protein